jgi:hypothetical protein
MAGNSESGSSRRFGWAGSICADRVVTAAAAVDDLYQRVRADTGSQGGAGRVGREGRLSEDFPVPGGLAAGSRLARYRVEEPLGAGGMAVVYRAHDERLGRLVSPKVLAPALAADGEFRRRFIAESRAAAAVDHPHIIPVYEAGQAGQAGQGHRTAGAAARGCRAAPHQAQAPAGLGRPCDPRRADPTPSAKAADAAAGHARHRPAVAPPPGQKEMDLPEPARSPTDHSFRQRKNATLKMDPRSGRPPADPAPDHPRTQRRVQLRPVDTHRMPGRACRGIHRRGVVRGLQGPRPPVRAPAVAEQRTICRALADTSLCRQGFGIPRAVTRVGRTAENPSAGNGHEDSWLRTPALPKCAATIQRGSMRRAGQLRDQLADARGSRVVFLSHCLLNQNVRYLGGAGRAGGVDEVVNHYLARGIGICQRAGGGAGRQVRSDDHAHLVGQPSPQQRPRDGGPLQPAPTGAMEPPTLAPLCVKRGGSRLCGCAPVLAAVKQSALDCGCGPELSTAAGTPGRASLKDRPQ